MWDNFWRGVIFILVVAAIVASCTTCSSRQTKESKQVDDISDSCKCGLKMAEVSVDDDDKRITVICAEPPKR
jgi:hypothetical protein